MGAHKFAGFTIIETMLFFAVSGILIIMLLVGVGASLNTQRYRDSVETFKSLLQQQYADITSVQNSRDDNWSCGNTATPSTTGTVQDNRGQSNCVLLGKYVLIQDDKVSVYKVVGYQTSELDRGDDVSSLKNNYVMNVDKGDVESSTLEWGTQIAYPTKTNNTAYPRPPSPRSIGILVVRSPDSGQVYTFSTSDTDVTDEASLNPTTLANTLVAGDRIPGQGGRLICIQSNGLLQTSDRGVWINSFASTAGAVELRTNEFMETANTGMAC